MGDEQMPPPLDWPSGRDQVTSTNSQKEDWEFNLISIHDDPLTKEIFESNHKLLLVD